VRSQASIVHAFHWFFPLAALYAALAVLVWLGGLSGMLSLPPDPTLWHGHEMLYGFAVAVIAGFVLTAVANWTGLRPAGPTLLALLCGLWLAGRLAALGQFHGALSPALAGLVDSLFLPALAAVMTRVLVRSRNLRNAMFIPFLWGLALLNLGYHALVAQGGMVEARLILTFTSYLVAFLLVFMGGRVIPFFSGRRCQYQPRQWPWLNWLSTLSALAAAAALTWLPGTAVAAGLAALAALSTAARLAAWQSPRIWSEPMLWILHLGYAWLALAFALAAAVHAGALAWPMSAPMHALMSGALGCLALGMMTRVALGHSGRPIVASRAMIGAFVLVTAAGLARLGSYMDWPGGGLTGLAVSAILWALAYSVYALEFMTRLWLPIRDASGGDHQANPSAS
jgi:uncharacterized protein involved in response to NO